MGLWAIGEIHLSITPTFSTYRVHVSALDLKAGGLEKMSDEIMHEPHQSQRPAPPINTRILTIQPGNQDNQMMSAESIHRPKPSNIIPGEFWEGLSCK